MNEFIERDEDGITLVFELPENEKEWWTERIRYKRNSIVKTPEVYVSEGLTKSNFERLLEAYDYESAIKELRSSAWAHYIRDEAIFHKEIIMELIGSREMPNSILRSLLCQNSGQGSFPSDFGSLSGLVGDFSGRIMPYLYQLSLSTTNSRRSRAGTTFEKVVSAILDARKITHEDQGKLGNQFYRDNNLSKMVDVVVPSSESYLRDRMNCAILTLKTTLRERWSEVVEEIDRTNIPHLFLLTLDEQVTIQTVQTLGNYNVTLVVYDSIKREKFSDFDNVKGYRSFFDFELPHRVSYWENR